MKNTFILLLTAAVTTLSLFAHIPQKMDYQAVIRDGGNKLVVNTGVGMRVSLLQGSPDGAVVYAEARTPVTNGSGLVTFQIGGDGTNTVTGIFSDINWNDGPYFLKTETDLSGGSNYTITGTTQLLSMPYALHAGTTDILKGEITENQISDLQSYFTGEGDHVFGASPSSGIEEGDISVWNEVHSRGDHDGLYRPHDWKPDRPDMPEGTAVGELRYWNGNSWVTLAPGNEGQILMFSAGAPKWKTIAGPTDITSVFTGRIWMDRNLGASRGAITRTDAQSYGHYYQWGRGNDGHQLRTSPTTGTLSDRDTPGHGNFITTSSAPNDWRSPQNNDLWQGLNGINNPCPAGYRLPTEAEWNAEVMEYVGFLGPYVPFAGYRHNSNGQLHDEGFMGYYWSSTISGIYSRIFRIRFTHDISAQSRAIGCSVRCIKD
jgi:uncharacterized protein (TIGR02145 family)